MCNVTDVKQTMAYLKFAFVTNLQFSVCPTITKTTLMCYLKLHYNLLLPTGSFLPYCALLGHTGSYFAFLDLTGIDLWIL